MNILFLNMATLSSNAGHLARFNLELEDLKKISNLGVICLDKQEDDEKTRIAHPEISFYHVPLTASGWEVKNIEPACDEILRIAQEFDADLVILQMEAWDLMRELHAKLKGKVPFATIVHAMPFVVSPMHPSGDFDKDALEYANSGIEEYRKSYIVNHFREARALFKEINIIANNKTVEYYLKSYFNNLRVFTLSPSLVSKLHETHESDAFEYDFAYMARFEKGKGLEYLKEILRAASNQLSRKVSLLIMGRADDAWSKEALEELTRNQEDDREVFEIKYVGWADEKTKAMLSACRVFLYPSTYDNYPTVVNEALSFGLPVITWKVPFFRINYSECGAIKGIKPFDTVSFARAAVEAMRNRDWLSAKAAAFAVSFDTPDKVANSDLGVFNRIISMPA